MNRQKFKIIFGLILFTAVIFLLPQKTYATATCGGPSCSGVSSANAFGDCGTDSSGNWCSLTPDSCNRVETVQCVVGVDDPPQIIECDFPYPLCPAPTPTPGPTATPIPLPDLQPSISCPATVTVGQPFNITTTVSEISGNPAGWTLTAIKGSWELNGEGTNATSYPANQSWPFVDANHPTNTYVINTAGPSYTATVWANYCNPNVFTSCSPQIDESNYGNNTATCTINVTNPTPPIIDSLTFSCVTGQSCISGFTSRVSGRLSTEQGSNSQNPVNITLDATPQTGASIKEYHLSVLGHTLECKNGVSYIDSTQTNQIFGNVTISILSCTTGGTSAQWSATFLSGYGSQNISAASAYVMDTNNLCDGNSCSYKSITIN